MKMTTEQFNHWCVKVDSQKERLAHETAEFEKNCATKYVREGHSEDLDKYIDYMAVEFSKISVKAQMGINLMEDKLANAEIVEDDGNYN